MKKLKFSFNGFYQHLYEEILQPHQPQNYVNSCQHKNPFKKIWLSLPIPYILKAFHKFFLPLLLFLSMNIWSLWKKQSVSCYVYFFAIIFRAKKFQKHIILSSIPTSEFIYFPLTLLSMHTKLSELMPLKQNQ